MIVTLNVPDDIAAEFVAAFLSEQKPSRPDQPAQRRFTPEERTAWQASKTPQQQASEAARQKVIDFVMLQRARPVAAAAIDAALRAEHDALSAQVTVAAE